MIPNEISDFELFLNKQHLNILKELAKREITSTDETRIINLLDKIFIYFFYSKNEFSFDKIFRLTINKNILGSNRRIKNIGNLKYNPDVNSITKYGRCNLPKQSMFYGSLLQMTSMSELKPKAGDLVTESTWKLKSLKPLHCVSIFSNQPTSKPIIHQETREIIRLRNIRTHKMDIRFRKQIEDFPKNLKELGLLVVQFIADCFSKEINSSNHWDYIFSAYVSDKFLNVIDDNIDAIYYPSVQDKLNTENLAIKPKVFDQLYDLYKVQEGFVKQDPTDGLGSYVMDSIASCKTFNLSTNEIIWDYKRYDQSADTIEFLKKHYGVDLD